MTKSNGQSDFANAVGPAFSPEVKEALDREGRRLRSQRLVVVLAALMVALFILGYVFDRESRSRQEAVVKELKTLPLPANVADEDFSSGYQPWSRGRASRTILAGIHPKELCDFYASLLISSGWLQTDEKCYPGDRGHVLIALRKGHQVFELVYLGGDVMGRTKYVMSEGWFR